ncbi:hypothetical protein ACTMU2_15650 [Cupriavidus basilensis]
MARRLVAGTVWINRRVGVDPLVPFGGAKPPALGGSLDAKGYSISRKAVPSLPFAQGFRASRRWVPVLG